MFSENTKRNPPSLSFPDVSVISPIKLIAMEFPQSQGFDLLDPSHDSKKLEDLPKVALMEDEDGNIHLR